VVGVAAGEVEVVQHEDDRLAGPAVEVGEEVEQLDLVVDVEVRNSPARSGIRWVAGVEPLAELERAQALSGQLEVIGDIQLASEHPSRWLRRSCGPDVWSLMGTTVPASRRWNRA
jgi:hypothetical protein